MCMNPRANSDGHWFRWCVDEGPYAWASPDGREFLSSGNNRIVARGDCAIPPECTQYHHNFNISTNTKEVVIGFAPAGLIEELKARGAQDFHDVLSYVTLYIIAGEDGRLGCGVDLDRQLFYVTRDQTCIDVRPLDDCKDPLIPLLLTRWAPQSKRPVRVHVSVDTLSPDPNSTSPASVEDQLISLLSLKARLSLWTGIRMETPPASALTIFKAHNFGVKWAYVALSYYYAPTDGLIYFEMKAEKGLAMLGYVSDPKCTRYCMYFSTGSVYCEYNPEFSDSRGPSFARDDVVGCGFDCKKRRLFFTLNGTFLGVFHSAPKLGDITRVQPVLGYTAEKQPVINWGSRPFSYNLDTLESALRSHEVNPHWPVSAERIHFPPEIVLTVLSFIQPSETDIAAQRRDIQTLAACRLVCRYWSALLRPRLFARVQLQSPQNFVSFRDLLTSASAPGAAPLPLSRVHITDENGGHRSLPWKSPVRTRRWSHQCGALPRGALAGVDTLSLDMRLRYAHSGRGEPSELPPRLALHPFLPFAPFAGIARLVLTNVSFRSFRAFARLAAFASLRMLECVNVWWWDAEGAARRVGPAMRRLRVVGLREVRMRWAHADYIQGPRGIVTTLLPQAVRWQVVQLLVGGTLPPTGTGTQGTDTDAEARPVELGTADHEFAYALARIVDEWGYDAFQTAAKSFGDLEDVSPDFVLKWRSDSPGEDILHLPTTYEPKSVIPSGERYRYALHVDFHLAPHPTLQLEDVAGSKVYLTKLVINIDAVGLIYTLPGRTFWDLWKHIDAAVKAARLTALQSVHLMDKNGLLEKEQQWMRQILENMPHCRQNGLLRIFKASGDLLIHPDQYAAVLAPQ